MLLLFLGKESPEHSAFLWVMTRFSCPEFSMHELYLAIYSQKKTKALWDKKLETHFLLSLIGSRVLAFLTSGFSGVVPLQSPSWQKLLGCISPAESLHAGKLWLISAPHCPGRGGVKNWALQHALSPRDGCKVCYRLFLASASSLAAEALKRVWCSTVTVSISWALRQGEVCRESDSSD